MERALILLVRGYQVFVSPLLPPNTCRFYPTCSNYAIDSLKKHGVLSGCVAALKRILKCHPWNRGGFDPA